MTQKITWGNAPCPMCRSGKPSKRLITFSHLKSTIDLPPELSRKGLSVVRCDNCSLCYLTPRPDRMSMDYVYSRPDYFSCDSSTGYNSYMDQEHALKKTFRMFLKRLEKKGSGKNRSIADIGCGYGHLLSEGRNFFSYCAGTDMSPETCSIASDSCDLAVCGGAGDLYRKTGRKFDLVTAVSVLEHVYDPISFMKECRDLLNLDGRLALAVPDIESFWNKVMGRHWISYKLPEHISYYSKSSLKNLGKRSGLDLIETFPYHHFFPLNVIMEKTGMKGLSLFFKKTDLNILIPSVMTAAVYKRATD